MKKTQYFQNCLGVFQGGGVKAIAYAGAYEEAINRGVFFSELIGTSAGSIVAVLIGAGATPTQLNEILNRLDFNKFLQNPVPDPLIRSSFWFRLLNWSPNKQLIQFAKFARYLGIYNAGFISEWINKELQTILGKNERIKFEDLIIPTLVVATDLRSKKIKIWGENSLDDVGLAVQTSCSIPFYFQPHELRYVDGGLLSNLPAFVLKPKTIFDKILAFSFINNEVGEIDTYKKMFEQLLNTTIDGATDIQLQLQKHVYVIKINPGSVQATDFSKITDDNKIDLIKNGKLATADFFDKETQFIVSAVKNDDIGIDIFETFNFLARTMFYKINTLRIADDNPFWIYSLFPMLLKWINEGAKVEVILKTNGEKHNQRIYKKWLLANLGGNVCEKESLPFRGILINSEKEDGEAIIFCDPASRINSKYYKKEEDSTVINMLNNEFNSAFTCDRVIPIVKFEFIEADSQNIFALLRNVKQYSQDDIHIETKVLEIEKIKFLTKFTKGYKFRQVKHLFDLYRKNGIDFFKPAMIKFGENKFSYVTPPIIELHGSDMYVIEGNARLLYAYKNNIKEVNCILIQNVIESLPSTGNYSVKQLLITDSEKRGANRYERFDASKFRRIEENIHDINKI